MHFDQCDDSVGELEREVRPAPAAIENIGGAVEFVEPNPAFEFFEHLEVNHAYAGAACLPPAQHV